MGLTVYGGGGKPEEEKTVTAGTSVTEVNPSSGKVMKKVIVNPTPTEEKTITAGTSATTVAPTNGKYIKKVTVNPTPSQSKTVTPSTSQQTVSPDSGKLLSQVIVKAMEDVTPEVTAQTPMISQILSNLGFTADSASGTNKQKLQTNNANLAKIEDYLPHGVYVWKKLTAQGGDFVNFVVSDQSTAYPDGGTQGGYWYETLIEGFNLNLLDCSKYAVDIITFSSCTRISSSNPIAHSLGEVPKLAIIIAQELPTLNDGHPHAALSIIGTVGSKTLWGEVGWNQYRNDVGGYYGKLAVMTATTIYPTTPLNGYMQSGMTYKLYTFA